MSTNSGGRPLIGLSLFATGSHPQGWRLPEADPHGTFDPIRLRRVAQDAEAHGLDFILLGDRLVSIPTSELSRPFEVQRPEALTTAAFIAAVTSRIGIITTVNATYAEPFNIARAVAQLDHMSAGRIGLNLVTGKNAQASLNFGVPDHADARDRYGRASEFVTVLRQLWHSWEPDATIADKETGAFLRGGSVRPIDFAGRYLSVRGPINIPRPPQGSIPIGVAGSSDESMLFGATHAEFRYMPTVTLERAVDSRRSISSALEGAGRAPSAQRLIEGFVPYVAETLDDAQSLFHRVQRVARGGSASSLAKFCGLPPEALLSVDDVRGLAAFAYSDQLRSTLEQWQQSTGREQASVDELAVFIRREKGERPLVGTGETVADYLEERFVSGAADAFVLAPPFMPGGLDTFLEIVVPVLRRRGLLADGPPADTTFRELLGTTVPMTVGV